nr:probable cytochrome P450 301a1, mitochondrial [Penaeus vannamei]
MILGLLRCPVASRSAALRSSIRAAGAAEIARVPGAGNSRRRATVAAEALPAEPLPVSEIPGPRRWPVVASMPYILTHKEYEKSRIYKLWDACEREFGPIFRLDMPGQAPSVFISEPGDIEHVLKSTAKNQQRDLFSSLKYVRDTHDFFKKDKSGIMSEQGDEWWRVRRRVQPYTAKPKHVELYLPVCQDFAFGPPDVPIRFHSFVQSSVAESEAALETRSPDAEGDGLTLVEMLLLDPELSREDAHAYLMDLLTAGIDAVAIKAAFVLTLLAQHPEEQQKVHEELDAVLGDGTQPLTPQHLAKLRYTKACVKEVLRISSPSTLTSRQLVEDTVICGYLVPKGFNVNLLLRPAGKKEEYFARPAEFLPERWLRGQALRSINPYASMPFGLGTRSCVGRRLSEQQTYTLLARLLHKYRLEWHYGPLNPIMLFTLFPDKPLRLKMIDRKV